MIGTKIKYVADVHVNQVDILGSTFMAHDLLPCHRILNQMNSTLDSPKCGYVDLDLDLSLHVNNHLQKLILSNLAC